jgi:hypothetical protein
MMDEEPVKSGATDHRSENLAATSLPTPGSTVPACAAATSAGPVSSAPISPLPGSGFAGRRQAVLFGVSLLIVAATGSCTGADSTGVVLAMSDLPGA